MTVEYVVLGAGNRGSIYARWAAEHPDRARVVAVAEPNTVARDRLAEACGVPAQRRYDSWQALLADGRLADSAIIATQDADHVEPALAALAAGYHVLLEKPMAPTEAECRAIASAAQASGSLFAVCHVLRYTPYTRLVREVIASGVLGRIASVQHLEPIGWWHFAHSYVRGNWRTEASSSSLLLAKSCHDLDWLAYVMGSPIERVSSFGSLRHFRSGEAPPGAADRCVDCVHQTTCPYSAVDLYVRRPVGRPDGWPLYVLSLDPDRVAEAVADGPYGRCVYACDNDVVDHQVVALEFADGATGSFTLTAFTEKADRVTRIFGSHGTLEGDGDTVRVLDFATRQWTTHRANRPGAMDAGSGHGGGDDGLMDAWSAAVAAGDPALVSSDAASALASHLAVFGAERARKQGCVVTVGEGQM